RRTAPAGARGTRASRAREGACASSGRPTPRTRRARRDPPGARRPDAAREGSPPETLPCRDDAQLLGDARTELVERVGELPHSFVLQRRDHVAAVDPARGQLVEHGLLL